MHVCGQFAFDVLAGPPHTNPFPHAGSPAKPVGAIWHTPFKPPVHPRSAASHASHAPEHVVSQQYPFTQWFEAHVSSVVHAEPRGSP